MAESKTSPTRFREDPLISTSPACGAQVELAGWIYVPLSRTPPSAPL